MNSVFNGIRVLDFSINIAGPVAAAMLGDFGADVIKLEEPKMGDAARAFSPIIDGRSSQNLWTNRGKRSLAINLKDHKAVEVVHRLIETADVMIESFRPGVMGSLGFGYDLAAKINPRMVYCSVSLFGQKGPLSKESGYDLIAQAKTGMMDTTGYPDGPPQRNGFAIFDQSAAHNAFGGIAAALFHRERTGEGQYVDIGLFNCGFACNGFVEQALLGYPLTRTGDHHRNINPYGSFTCRHGSIIIIAPTQKLWETICRLMDREDLITNPNFSTSVARLKRLEETTQIIVGWLDSFQTLKDAEMLLKQNGIPCAKVNDTFEAIDTAVEADYGMLVDLEWPEETGGMRSIKARGAHIKLSKTPASIKTGCPDLGADSRDILLELGYNQQDAETMIANWNRLEGRQPERSRL